MMMRRLCGVATATLLLTALSARAESVVYNQIGSQQSGNWPEGWYSHSQVLKDLMNGIPTTYDQRLADDFTLGFDSTINQVTVSGTISGSAGLTGVNVYLYSNNSGVPGSLLQTVSGTSLTTPQSDVSQQYTIDISASPLSVSANTTYWLSVQPIFAEVWENWDTTTFRWNLANDEAIPSNYAANGAGTVDMDNGTVGNQWGRYDIIGDGLFTITGWHAEAYSGSLPAGWQAMDLSFSLTGTGGVQTPEPGAFVLSAIGSLGMLVYAWRKRK